MKMEINNIVSAGLVSVDYPQIKNDKAKPSSEVSETNKIDTESIWHKIAAKYDVRNITTEETGNLSQELYDAGEISLFDHAILSFDPDHFVQSGTGFLTKADSTGHRDLISEYEARIEMDKKMNDTKNIVNNERILGYLHRLEAAKKQPIHITV